MAGKNDNFDALMAMMALKHIMPDISHLKEGFEIPFEVKMKKSAINKLFQPCFGREPYRNLEKCAKCILKEDCVVAKIENNFNMRLRAYHP